MRNVRMTLALSTILLLLLGGCVVQPITSVATEAPAATPTVDPAIYNQVPATTVFEAGQCTAVLASPAAAYTSSTLGGQSTGEIPAGSYEVAVAADYGSSLWYMLNGVGETNFINSASVSSTEGDCATSGG